MTDREKVIVTMYTGKIMVEKEKWNLVYQYAEELVNYPHLRSLRSLRSGGLSLSGSENDFLNLLPL